MTNPVVHLELHTPNLGRACAFYDELLGWRPVQPGLIEDLDKGHYFG